jgi:hypothetical protein
MQKQLATMRMIAIALALFLVIAIIVIVNDRTTISRLRSPAQQNITAQRDIIREDCAGTDADSQKKCADDLQSLSDLLGEFSKNLHPAAAATQ